MRDCGQIRAHSLGPGTRPDCQHAVHTAKLRHRPTQSISGRVDGKQKLNGIKMAVLQIEYASGYYYYWRKRWP